MTVGERRRLAMWRSALATLAVAVLALTTSGTAQAQFSVRPNSIGIAPYRPPGSITPSVPGMRIIPTGPRFGVPDVLPMIEREDFGPRGVRLPSPTRCDSLDGGRTCARRWVTDDWRASPPRRRVGTPTGQRPRAPAMAVTNRNYVANQVVAELDPGLSDAQLRALTRRHRLTRISGESFALIGASVALFRIDDRRSPLAVAQRLAADLRVRTAQANYRYALQAGKPVSGAADPTQYALTKLRLPQAHALAQGHNVVVAVIDSGIDAAHPELAGAITGRFDALGGGTGPDLHGTGIAGAIVAHAKLTGGAPAAKLVAIRAFGPDKAAGEGSTSYLILKSLDYAARHGARIVNMSFAGPNDPLVARGVGALAAKGTVMVAAGGNAGPSSPPLYPAGYPGVIGVGATDAADALFAASNRGDQIAVAAPGVDLLLPAPGGKYEMQTGTSFAAALISGVAALMLQADPTLQPDELRAILTQTARDLGPPGRDDQFGAGAADAFAAVSAAYSRSALAATPSQVPTTVTPPVASVEPAPPAQAAEAVRDVVSPSAAPAAAAPQTPSSPD